MTGFYVDPGRIMGFGMLVDRGFGDLKATERLGERINNLIDQYEDFTEFVQAIQTALDLIHGGRLTVPDRDIAPLPPAPYDFPMP